MATVHYCDLVDWTEKFKCGSLHLVCVAADGFTTCDCAASVIGGMNKVQEVWPFTREVNRRGEVGCFWPRLPLTLLPQTSWEGRPDRTDAHAFLQKCFSDVAEINRLHIKFPDVFVDLNSYGGDFETEIAFSIAREILSKETSISNLWLWHFGVTSQH